MPDQDSHELYTALKSRDSRFDGRFFVGVSSTGVYCRPVCRARLPKEENCSFYVTAAEAEQAGYRPCLLCRPELAPGKSLVDATTALANRAARYLEENCGSDQGLDHLAGRLGYSDRHLRRVFQDSFHVSPIQYLQTCRLLMAKNLLTETELPITEVALVSGFGSLRRFNDLFRKHYRLTPSALRKQATTGKWKHEGITLSLGYRRPYRWMQIVEFLAARAIPKVEKVEGETYMRMVRMTNRDGKTVLGSIRVSDVSRRNALAVTVDASLLSVLPQVLGRVRHLFDLYCDPQAVYETLESMNEFKAGLCWEGTRLPGCFDSFEMATRAILGQQITVKAARTLAARLAETYGAPVETGIEGLSHAFFAPEDILALDGPIENHLGPLGVTAKRAQAIRTLAQALVNKDIDLDHCDRPQDEMKKLMALPGIGAWTANYIAMRTMAWTDAFPSSDYGVKKALEPLSEKEIVVLAEKWRPWRAYATVNLWNSLSGAH